MNTQSAAKEQCMVAHLLRLPEKYDQTQTEGMTMIWNEYIYDCSDSLNIGMNASIEYSKCTLLQGMSTVKYE